MDGGIDQAITEFFGQQLPDRVQKHIIKEYGGCQPIGTSFIIETLGERYALENFSEFSVKTQLFVQREI